jgi:hypothetical protein
MCSGDPDWQLTSLRSDPNISGRGDRDLRAGLHFGLLFALAAAISVACAAQESAAPPVPVSPSHSPSVAIDCGVFAAGDPSLDLVSKLCGFALTYRGKLPDFIAQQTTTSQGPQSTVLISAQVTYRKGLEHYSQFMINGKPVPPKGWVNVDLRLFTSGEFGPLLINLFEVPGAVEFKFSKTDTFLGAPVAVFDFHLPKNKNTFWAIRDARGVSLKPEFHGHLWVEAQTGRIVREEVNPVLDAWQNGITSMKLSTDYSMAKVSGLGTYLLPAKSESNVCMVHLGTNLGCTRNTTVFRDYQKFVATSRIVPTVPEP